MRSSQTSMRTMRRPIVLAAAIALSLPATGRAEMTPPGGTLDRTHALVEYAGSTSAAGYPLLIAEGNTEQWTGLCEPDLSCETFTLEVRDAPSRLHVAVAIYGPGDYVRLQVVRPDGSMVDAAGSPSTTGRLLSFESPANGTYEIRIAGDDIDFRGAVYTTAATGNAIYDNPGCAAGLPYAHPASSGGPANGAPVNDPLYAVQWGLQQIKVPAAWKRGFTGEGVTIAIVDTGVDARHPEFAGRLLAGYDSLPSESADCAPGAQDDHGHGTAVASLAAAGTNDGLGVAGIAYKARILPVKVCSATPVCNFNDELARGVRFAIANGADVINLSIGSEETDKVLYPQDDLELAAQLVKEAWDAGIVVVGVAGNGNQPRCVFPGRAPGALCAAGTASDGLPSDFSGLPNGDEPFNGVRAPAGENASMACVDLIAVAWWPGGEPVACDFGSPAYTAWVGTSFAAPHVSGLAALLKQAGLTNRQIVERIRLTASNKGEKDPVMGYGLIDADAATQGLTPKSVAKTPPRLAKPKRVTKACRHARAASLRATRSAVRAKRALRKARGVRARRRARRTLSRRIGVQRRAVRMVARVCR